MKKLYSFLAALALAILAGCDSTDQSHSSHPDSLPLGNPHEALYGTTKIHYLTTGTGPYALVLVHCWCGNLNFWREQVPALRAKARLILIDLPGHGQSDKPETNYTMDYFAGAVLAVMRDAHIDKATLIGHSMGTPIICRVYAQAPDKVAALVAVDGTMRKQAMTPGQSTQFIAPFRGPGYRVAASNLISTMFPIPGTETLRNQVINDLLKTPQYVMVSAMEGMFGAEQPDWNIQHAIVPVISINTANPMWGNDYKTFFRSLSSLNDYRSLDGTGHWLMLEKPVEFNLALLDSLRKFGLIGQ